MRELREYAARRKWDVVEFWTGASGRERRSAALKRMMREATVASSMLFSFGSSTGLRVACRIFCEQWRSSLIWESTLFH